MQMGAREQMKQSKQRRQVGDNDDDTCRLLLVDGSGSSLYYSSVRSILAVCANVFMRVSVGAHNDYVDDGASASVYLEVPKRRGRLSTMDVARIVHRTETLRPLCKFTRIGTNPTIKTCEKAVGKFARYRCSRQED